MKPSKGNVLATVTKGAVSSTRKGAPAAPKVLREVISEEDKGKRTAISYVSTKGADAAWVIPPGPVFNAAGVQIGNEPGVHLDFRGVGVTGPYFPDKPEHRKLIEKIDNLIDENWSIVEDLGLKKLEPEMPRPPFRKWDKLSASAIKVAFLATLDEENHDGNVEIIKEAARYEVANQDREDVLGVLNSLLVSEATESDSFTAEVKVS